MRMFEHMIEENNLMDELRRYNLDERDVDFIKEQINGPLETEISCSLPDSVSI